MKAVLPDLPAARSEGFRLHLTSDFIGVDGIQVHVSGHRANVGTTRHDGHFLEGVFIQPGEDNLAGAVFFKAAGRFGYGHPLAVAHADAKQLDFLFF